MAVVVDELPIVLPVKYQLVEASVRTWVAVRTRAGTVLDRGSKHATFEIDGTDSVHRRGWSVLVRGTVEHVDPDAAAHALRSRTVDRIRTERVAIIEPSAITGRLQPADLEWAFHDGAYV